MCKRTRARHNQVFQDKSVVQIVEAVFADYAEHASWHWSDEVSSFLETARPRSYCVQYRESDYAFVSRLLAEEGIGWCVEEDKDARPCIIYGSLPTAGSFPKTACRNMPMAAWVSAFTGPIRRKISRQLLPSAASAAWR